MKKKNSALTELMFGRWYNAKKINPPEKLVVIASCFDDANVLQGLQFGYVKRGRWVDYGGELMLFQPKLWQAFNNNLDNPLIRQ